MRWTKDRPTQPGFYFIDVRGVTALGFDSTVGVAYIRCHEGVWLVGDGGLRTDDPQIEAFAGPILPPATSMWIAPPVGSRVVFDGEEAPVVASSETQATAKLSSGETVHLGPASEIEGRWHRVPTAAPEPVWCGRCRTMIPAGLAECPCREDDRREEQAADKAAGRVSRLEAALTPLAAIADAFDANDLDEARPEWGTRQLDTVELLAGRGGKRLLTLADAFAARDVLRELRDRKAVRDHYDSIE